MTSRRACGRTSGESTCTTVSQALPLPLPSAASCSRRAGCSACVLAGPRRSARARGASCGTRARRLLCSHCYSVAARAVAAADDTEPALSFLPLQTSLLTNLRSLPSSPQRVLPWRADGGQDQCAGTDRHDRGGAQVGGRHVSFEGRRRRLRHRRQQPPPGPQVRL